MHEKFNLNRRLDHCYPILNTADLLRSDDNALEFVALGLHSWNYGSSFIQFALVDEPLSLRSLQ